LSAVLQTARLYMGGIAQLIPGGEGRLPERVTSANVAFLEE